MEAPVTRKSASTTNVYFVPSETAHFATRDTMVLTSAPRVRALHACAPTRRVSSRPGCRFATPYMPSYQIARTRVCAPFVLCCVRRPSVVLPALVLSTGLENVKCSTLYALYYKQKRKKVSTWFRSRTLRCTPRQISLKKKRKKKSSDCQRHAMAKRRGRGEVEQAMAPAESPV